MADFFVRRPIVAMVIAILTVLVGLVSMLGLPIAQFPNIVPPQINVSTTYIGADALTVEQSVATPIEQQMSGVDNMEYMQSTNANNGSMTLAVTFGLSTDPNTDQILAQMRVSQAESQLPSDVRNFGITVQKSTASPLILFGLYSEDGTYDANFLANYAYINLNDQFTRVPGIASVTVYGSGQYAMRFWVRPDQLAKLNITVPEIVQAIQVQNTVNPAGSIGAEPVPEGQQYTYAVSAQGRLTTEEEFGDIVVRANVDGSFVRLRDVARISLGSQTYNLFSRLNGKPAAVLALYQLPGTNALAAAEGAKALMEKAKQSFPPDLDYLVALDTTLAVTEGVVEIEHTLYEALLLVILVVFIFLQGWRATLIPLLAVPVSLIGTFALFPLFGFSINTLSLFGLVLAIGLVVDDAIVVVEAVEHHIENGLSPKEATLQAMREVSGPVIAIALILSAVFVPTAFLPGITGQLYQQFALTIAISVLLSAFNALTLSPALASIILRPRKESKGPLGLFFKGFNKAFGKITDGYVAICHFLIKNWILGPVALLVAIAGIVVVGKMVPGGFLPEEDQGYVFVGVQLPYAASLQRTDKVCRQVEEILKSTPGVQNYVTVVGFSLLSGVQNTYSGFFFVQFTPWSERKKPEEKADAIMAHINRALREIPAAVGFAFPPPAIPGVGTSGGITFILQDQGGRDVQFLADETTKYMDALRKRPEAGMVSTTLLPDIPQLYVNVDRDKVLKQGVSPGDVYQTLQCFMGGIFVNYFNRFGRQWQVYVEAEGDFRTRAENIGRFYVKNKDQDPVPLSAFTQVERTSGPEFTMRFNLYRSAQINAAPAPGYSGGELMAAMEEVYEETKTEQMGYTYSGMSYQTKLAAEGVSPLAIFGLSLLFVFLILAAQYESWTLPFSVLLSVPIAVLGAFVALLGRQLEFNIYAQIGLVMLIGLSAKNAILIVEFCKMRHEQGVPLAEAALEGARLRLRPILMTAFAFILGCVPLWTASGAGAISRQVMGTAVIGGMLASSLLAIFLVPVLFYIVEKFSGVKDLPAPTSPTSKVPTKPETGGH